MPFCPNSSLFWKNNARNIKYMPVLIFPKRLDFEQNAYSRTSSWFSNLPARICSTAEQFICKMTQDES